MSQDCNYLKQKCKCYNCALMFIDSKKEEWFKKYFIALCH